MSLSLLTLNCEEDKHLDLILPYLIDQKFEVICLQEVLQENLSQLAEAANAQAFYTPLAILNGKVWGIALLIRLDLKVRSSSEKYYKGEATQIPTFTFETPNEVNRAILSVQLEKEGKPWRFTTTHFTWASGGGSSPDQERDFPNLLHALNEVGETVLCGDFNAPRGLQFFDDLAVRYKDNIPADVKTTIDQNLHRVKGLQLVVDGMFSSPIYHIKNVKLVSDLSDHCGIQGDVFLNE
ncbi:hypothetical protein BH10PAT2_BH10PAT2_0370 [soil metagenome]